MEWERCAVQEREIQVEPDAVLAIRQGPTHGLSLRREWSVIVQTPGSASTGVNYADLWVSLDRELVRAAAACVSVWDHGLLYGDGCFEGLGARNSRLFRPHDHLRRLTRSARALGLTVPLGIDEMLDEIGSVLTANRLTDAHVRVILTRGRGAPGLDPRRADAPSFIVMAYPFPPLLGTRPLSLIISSVARKSPRSVDGHIKSLNYLDAILAKLQANAAGADDAVMLDDLGHVAEVTSANVFVVCDDAIATPTTRSARKRPCGPTMPTSSA